MKLTFWGTRGSVPTPGKSTSRYGGNTPCVEVRLDNNELIILDAGTGIRNLGDRLMSKKEVVRAHLLITHPHWDHIQGFPFFQPIYDPGSELTIVGGESDSVTLHKMIADLMNKVYFPVRLEELKAKLHFRKVSEEEFPIYDATVRTMFLNHPSFSVGYRISYNRKTVVYISDNEPFEHSYDSMKKNIEPWVLEKYVTARGDPNQRVYDFVRSADVLIHDSTFTPEEYSDHIGWGHSHYLFTLRVAAEGEVKKLVLFHYNPAHSDDKVDDILRRCKGEIRKRKLRLECVAAAEGMTLDV